MDKHVQQLHKHKTNKLTTMRVCTHKADAGARLFSMWESEKAWVRCRLQKLNKA